jgi:DNA-binding IclR family transcriptional regulator
MQRGGDGATLRFARRSRGQHDGAEPSGPDGSIRTLDRAFAILELFTRQRPEWTTTEVARATDLPVPTAHRILLTLAGYGYVEREAQTKRFRLGDAAVRLGDRARTTLDLREVGVGILRKVSKGADVTALLWVVNAGRDRAVCVGRVESENTLRLSVFPGCEQPLHAGASRKTLLAHMDESEIERVARKSLPRLSRGTITDTRLLRADLRKIRERGWAESFEETDPGAWGVAVPILDQSSQIVAAIGVAVPTARFSRGEVVQQIRRLKVAALELTQSLGLAPRPVAPARRSELAGDE